MKGDAKSSDYVKMVSSLSKGSSKCSAQIP